MDDPDLPAGKATLGSMASTVETNGTGRKGCGTVLTPKAMERILTLLEDADPREPPGYFYKGLCKSRALYSRTRREDPTSHLSRLRLGSVMNQCGYYDIPVQMEEFAAGVAVDQLPRTWSQVLEMVHRQWETEWADTCLPSPSARMEDIQPRVVRLLSALMSQGFEARLWEAETIPVHESERAHRRWAEYACTRVSCWWMWKVFLQTPTWWEELNGLPHPWTPTRQRREG